MPDVHVKFLGEQITAREFLIDDIDSIFADNYAQERLLRDWDAAAGPAPVRWFDRLFDHEMVTARMVELSCGLSPNQLSQCRPSDLRVLVEAVREANPDFFAMMADRVNSLQPTPP